MDLRPVEAIAGITPASVKKTGEDIAPPFAVDGAARMEEDSYSADANQQQRGLEEEEPEKLNDPGQQVLDFAAEEPQKRVNFFA